MSTPCGQALREERLRATAAEEEVERLRKAVNRDEMLYRLRRVHAYLAHRSEQWHGRAGHRGFWVVCARSPCTDDLAELDATSPELEPEHA